LTHNPVQADPIDPVGTRAGGGNATGTGAALPTAAAYFPLTGQDLSSRFPAGAYEGNPHNLLWQRDPTFGEVLSCDQVGG
jgi:hypothetical protein